MFERIKGIFSPGIHGRYKVEGTLMRHPFYDLESARERKTMRPVCIRDYTDEGLETEAKLDRLYRRRPLVDLLGEIHNPHIVHTFETEASAERRIEVIEHVSGETLRARMDRGTMSGEEFRGIVTALGEALVYLHSLGLLHRGLCPESVMIAKDGTAKILDLSLVMDVSLANAGGTVVGPVGYTAPEVIARRNADFTSDVYSLGSLMYEMLSGQRLHPNARGYEGLLRLMNSRPAPLSERNPQVSAALEAVVMQAVEKDPRRRWQSVDDMMTAFADAPAPARLGSPAPAYAA